MKFAPQRSLPAPPEGRVPLCVASGGNLDKPTMHRVSGPETSASNASRHSRKARPRAVDFGGNARAPRVCTARLSV